jgi:hypothetical protein
MNTLIASRWTLFLARLFGVKRVTEDGSVRVTTYYWRGKFYLTDASTKEGE